MKKIFYRAIGKPKLAYQHNPRYDGGRDPFGKFFKENIWGKIVCKLDEEGIDNVQLFVHYAKKRYGTIFPQTLLSNELIQNFKRFQEKCLESLKLSLQEDREELRNHYRFWRQFYEPLQALRLTLTEESSISPLFRYVIARKANLYEIAALFQNEAKKRYQLAPRLYREVFGEIPELEESE